MFQIEVACSSFGIHDNCPGCHLPGTKPCPFQCVHQKKFPQALASQRLAYSHPPKKGYRERKAGQFLCQFFWQLSGLDRVCRKRVKTSDGLAVRSENEDGCQIALQILPGLSLEIGVKGLNTTGKDRSIMMCSKRLNLVLNLWTLSGQCPRTRFL